MQNLSITLESGGKTPMYEQLYRYFAAEIARGHIRPGEKLPSKRALQEGLGISRSTVETAYGLLAAEGYIEARPRSGYYCGDLVAPASPEPRSRPAPEREPERQPPRGPDFSTASVDVSQFPYATWAKLNKEVVYSSPELLRRGHRQGDLPLRRALARMLGETRGVRCAPEDIVVGAGMEYLTGLILQLLPEATVLGLEDPGYTAMADTALALGRQVRYIPLDEAGMREDELRKSDVNVCYVTPSHQFPMGVTMPASRRSRILRWASEEPDRYVIEDDYDSEFRYVGRPIPSLKSMDDRGRVIYVGTFSRSLAPSIRVAYAVLPGPLLAKYRALSAHRLSTVSRYEQAVLALLMDTGVYGRYLRRLTGLYARRRARLLAALGDIPGIEVSGDGGGMHFLIMSRERTEPELLESALEQGLDLAGLSRYCHRYEPEGGCLVLGYGGVEEAQLSDACERLRRALK
ncbi:MAG: PLP-dependent aminotransferase family protein [Oscillospiraceae bacterium]|nr:PLP-dependent aminotransferase family protein [Oscillospiraceae bacterium]